MLIKWNFQNASVVEKSVFYSLFDLDRFLWHSIYVFTISKCSYIGQCNQITSYYINNILPLIWILDYKSK